MEPKNVSSTNEVENSPQEIPQEPNNNPQPNSQYFEEEDEIKSLPVEQDLTSTYILKYTRNENELKEISQETELPKAQNCLFMLNLKIIKQNENSTNEEEKENFLAICCHEIAAVYFDEIYERIYSLKDLFKENKYFKVFEKVEEAKNIFDDMLSSNEKNKKKLFISFENKVLKLHMRLKFFDKEKEIMLNIPKKNLTNEEKVNLLPEFLKEIQDKMIHLEEENKKLRTKKNKLAMSYSHVKNNYKYEEEEEGEEVNNNNNPMNNSNKFQNKMNYRNENKENGFEKFNEFNSVGEDDLKNSVSNSKNGATTNSKPKKVKKNAKKAAKIEENFF